ncbi:MAG: LLM class flavin-dependent oxidoreductase [Chloroflexi bacterium]|nr:LLM class flavin-dependent oxidoreductase [Chloroflexota bacterium]
MRISISLGMGRDDWEGASTYVQEAERLGVHDVWSAEAWGYDAISPLAYMAAKTSTIRLGTGIVQGGTRTPALLAMTAMSMASLSNDRFVLGIGASGPQVVEGWHGISFKRQMTRMRELIEIVRLLESGERASYSGKVYTLPRPGGEGKAIRSSAPLRDPVPIYLATLSPKSLQMTGELADGWLGTSFMPEHADVFFDDIKKGAEKAGRSMSDIDLQAGGAVAFGDDIENMIPPRKPGLAFTLGAMGSREHNFYNRAFQRAGYKDVAIEVQNLWLDGNRDEARERVPDEMVLKTNLLGTEEMVKDRIRAYRDAGVTTLRVDPAGRDMKERLDTLGRLIECVKAVSEEKVPVG